jgi:multidrug transporter EmrE-like cation transporter
MLGLLLCSLSAFFAVEMLKHTIRVFSNILWLKLTVCVVVSACVALAQFPHNFRLLPVYALAGAGGAVIVHRLAFLFRRSADRHAAVVMTAIREREEAQARAQKRFI